MTSVRDLLLSISYLFAVIFLGLCDVAAVTRYQITVLDRVPGHNYSSVAAINEAGQIAGSSVKFVGYNLDEGTAVLWTNGNLVAIGDLPGGRDQSGSLGINNLSQVVGQGFSSVGKTRGFFWDNGQISDVGAFSNGDGTSVPYGINDQGQIVGSSDIAGDSKAFLLQNATFTDLGDLPGGEVASFALGINNKGDIVGHSFAANGSRAVLWKNGTMTDLGTLETDDQWSIAQAVNESGQIVGDSANIDGKTRAVMWHNGSISHLGLPEGADFANASGLNDSGTVVGQAWKQGEGSRAVIWDSQNGVAHLDDLVDPADPLINTVTFIHAKDINNSGYIAATGNLSSESHSRAFLLMPIEVSLSTSETRQIPINQLTLLALFLALAVPGLKRLNCA